MIGGGFSGRRLSGLLLISILSTLIGFSNQLLVAFNFGTSSELDEYLTLLAVLTAVCFFAHPLRESVVELVFRKNRIDTSLAAATINGALLFSVFFALVVITMALPSIFLALYEGRGAGRQNIFVLSCSFVVLFPLSEVLIAILLSFNLAIAQAFVRFSAAALSLITVFIFSDAIGVYSILLSLVFGQSLSIVVSIFLINKRISLFVKPNVFIFGDKKFVAMCASLLFSYLCSQIYLVTERLAIGAFPAGSLSAFQYAVNLINVLITLVALPVSNLLWPEFLRLESEGRQDRMVMVAWTSSSPVLFVLLAIVIFTFSFSSPIVELFYSRGQFDQDSVRSTATALRYVVFAALPISFVTLALRILMAGGRNREVALVGVIMAIVGTFCLAVGWFVERLDIAMLHWMLANFVGSVLSWYFVIRFAGAKGFSKASCLGPLLKAIFSIFVALATAIIASGVMGFTSRYLHVGIAGFVYLSVFAGMLWCTGIPMRFSHGSSQ